ncbi:MAG: two-component system, OmpR family, sensor kinase, partial [Solirubrobacteraceae bacterium]|nr:two-component system, OmpR family, sensor kinase [Solirubrobacteraceae bacterium]
MSLRARLLALLVALSAAGLLVVGGVSYAALRSYLSQRVDRQAVSALQEVYVDLDRIHGEHGFGPPGRPDGPERSIPEGTYGALRDKDDRLLNDKTFAFRDHGHKKPTIPARLPLSSDPDTPHTIDSGGYRFIAARTPAGGTIIAAVPLTDFTSTLNRLLRVELIVAAAVLALLAAAAFWLVRLGLSPLERMGRTAGAIAAGDLTQRVEPATERTEVGRLGLALNRMLGQIETAFAERTASEERLRAFLSDASHELRTPLASIRGYAELYRIGAARAPADQEKAMTRIEAEAKRMGVLVDDLLTLARLDEERELLREDVDLTALAHDAVDAARVAAPDRPVTLDANGPVLVEGDPDRLRQVLDNLVRNALTHTPDGTAVELRVARAADRAQLDVRDHGPGLPPGEPAALFERFWRAEAGRERGKAGAGLGLAIVAGI